MPLTSQEQEEDSKSRRRGGGGDNFDKIRRPGEREREREREPYSQQSRCHTDTSCLVLATWRNFTIRGNKVDFENRLQDTERHGDACEMDGGGLDLSLIDWLTVPDLHGFVLLVQEIQVLNRDLKEQKKTADEFTNQLENRPCRLGVKLQETVGENAEDHVSAATDPLAMQAAKHRGKSTRAVAKDHMKFFSPRLATPLVRQHQATGSSLRMLWFMEAIFSRSGSGQDLEGTFWKASDE